MRALIVAKAPDRFTNVRRDWETGGVRTDLVCSVEEAAWGLSSSAPDLVVLDGSLPRSAALDLYAIVRARSGAARPPVIFSPTSGILSRDPGVDYCVPEEAGPSAIASLGRAVLGIDPHEPLAGAAAPRAASMTAANGSRQNGQHARPTPAAGSTPLHPAAPHPTRQRTTRARALRGNGRAATPAEPSAPGPAQASAPAGSRAPRRRTGSDMSLVRFGLRWSWLVVLMTILGTAGGYAFLQYGPMPYQSTATLMLRPQVDATGLPVINANPQRSTQSALALAGLAAAPSVYDATSKALTGQMDIAPTDIGMLVTTGKIAISPVGSSSFITITATGSSPQRAWLLADGYSRGFLADLTAQTKVVSEQQQVDLRNQIDVIQQQIAGIPLNFNSRGTADTYNAVQTKMLQNLLDAQVKLQAAAQISPPVVRYGDTSDPVEAIDAKRVLVAGAAVGGGLGLALAYLGELIRQGIRRRRARSAKRQAARRASDGIAAAPPAAAPSRNGHGWYDTEHSARRADPRTDGLPEPPLDGTAHPRRTPQEPLHREEEPRWVGSARG